jgi:hypothetical protein
MKHTLAWIDREQTAIVIARAQLHHDQRRAVHPAKPGVLIARHLKWLNSRFPEFEDHRQQGLAEADWPPRRANSGSSLIRTTARTRRRLHHVDVTDCGPMVLDRLI